MFRKSVMILLMFGAGTYAAAIASPALADIELEAKHLKLRPQKEPGSCGKANCKGIQAPRINKRVSTIPGMLEPDHGRPKVNNNPLGKTKTAPLRLFGNPAISGN